MNSHKGIPPILIYQMGKVGSTSVYDSLKSSELLNPIYHVHSLNPSILKAHSEEFVSKHLKEPSHIKTGFEIIKLIDNNGIKDWKIITIVRDLMKNRVSRFFQNIERFAFDYPGLISDDNIINTDLILEILSEKFSNFNESREFICTWFDRELKMVFDVDIFDYKFNHEDGFTIINADHIDLLVLKTELLSTTFPKAIKTFLNIDFNLTLQNSNISETKDYHTAYKRVLHALSLSKEILQKVYSSKYMSHFYPRN